MEEISRSVEQECLKDFPCYYRRGRHCSFWVEAEAVSRAAERIVPPDKNCGIRLIDFLKEPCLEDREHRPDGVGDNLGKWWRVVDR